MKDLKIKPTENTPSVIFDYRKGNLVIQGDARPENAQKFFEPILGWLDEYYNYLFWISDQGNTITPVKFHFKLEYFNSTSAKHFLDIILKIKEGNEKKKLYEIIWWHDEFDADIKESGEEFSDLAGMEFTFRQNN